MTTHNQSFDFQVVSPEKILFQGTSTMTVLPATSGNIGVLAKHAPTILTLSRGIIDVYQGDQITHRLFVGGGFANISETKCLVMADDAIAVEDLKEDELVQYLQDVELAIEKTIIEEEMGKKIGKSAVHNMMRKLEFSYITPRPKHYKQVAEKQVEFKKKSEREDGS